MRSSSASPPHFNCLESANGFAVDWIAAWNSHDLDRILSFYRDDVVFSSPVLAKLMPETAGHLQGRTSLRAYWERALVLRPDLNFELIRVMTGVARCVVHYLNDRGRYCAESFVFDDAGRVVESHACVEFGLKGVGV